MTEIVHRATDGRVKALAADIANELREHPDHWFKGALVRLSNGDERGTICDAVAPEAACWCLVGHIVKRCKVGDDFDWKLKSKLHDAFDNAAPGLDTASWNDDPPTSIEDVIALCERIANGS